MSQSEILAPKLIWDSYQVVTDVEIREDINFDDIWFKPVVQLRNEIGGYELRE